MTPAESVPYDRARLVEVVTYHPMIDGVKAGSTCANPCNCGHGEDPADLGKSHAEHVADVYEASVAAAGGFAPALPTPLIQIDPGDAIFLNGVRHVPAAEGERLAAAARRLLDGCSPQVSALECEHGVSADDLYGDLAEALGLPRDYRPEGA